VAAIIAAGFLMAATISLLVWRLLRATNPATAAFLTPSSRTAFVACRPDESLGRPTVPRADLVTRSPGRHPHWWDWTQCGSLSSPASVGSWNARQWYSPEAEVRLVPPGSWDWKTCGSLSAASTGSRSQNWYRPSYHSPPAIPNYYADPQDRRSSIPAFYVTRDGG